MPRVSLKSHQKGTLSFCEDNVPLIERDELVRTTTNMSCIHVFPPQKKHGCVKRNGYERVFDCPFVDRFRTQVSSHREIAWSGLVEKIQCFSLPETNSKFTPENRSGPKRKGLYSKHPFSGVNSDL